MKIDVKILNKILYKWNSTIHKKDQQPWSSGIYSRDVRIIQHLKIYQYNITTLTKWTTQITWLSQKMQKSIWQNSASIHNKNSSQDRQKGI